MFKFWTVYLMVILFVSLPASAYSQATADENTAQWQTMNIEIAEIYDTTPVTLSFKTKNVMGKIAEDTLTLDPSCEFYLNDELLSSGSDIFNPGDMVKIEYVVSEGEKVAFTMHITR